ncbi:hypothetical protein EVAR_636_1 [Eumeta japonica]|uniref:Uncharacterized protein n=1 Tax=Eumeta variegata TaxID=151549 RepID=A0A4C1SBF1_EUMVA|nr:hypothetical protein EVAR_636_1 [Eumeta japonica]
MAHQFEFCFVVAIALTLALSAVFGFALLLPLCRSLEVIAREDDKLAIADEKESFKTELYSTDRVERFCYDSFCPRRQKCQFDKGVSYRKPIMQIKFPSCRLDEYFRRRTNPFDLRDPDAGMRVIIKAIRPTAGQDKWILIGHRARAPLRASSCARTLTGFPRRRGLPLP